MWIECASLTGSGYVTARDSFIGGSRISADTKGSGGRIAVYQRQATDFSDFPKSRILTQRMTYATPGTVYLESADTSSGTDLYVIGTGNNTSLKTVFPMPADGSDYSIYTNLNIHVGIASFLSIGRLTGGAPVEVRSLSVENTGMAETVAGCDLSVRSGLSIASNSSLASAGGDDLVFSGAEDATLYGLSRISGFAAIVCTNAGKALLFGSAANDTLTVEATSSLLLEGTAAEPVRLWPVDALSTWQVNLSSSAASSVKYVSVSNSNASAGTTVLAIDSTDLGGNNYWSFSTDIEPGETIVWTGGVSTDWTDGANWDRGRVPVETDDVVIERAGEFDPTLSSGTYLFNRVRIRPNAALTLDGATLTVTNLMLNSGTLEFAGAETLYLTGDAFFTNGTVVAAQSYVRIAGSGAQTIDFGNTSVGKVYVENPVGPINFAGHGFAAKSFNCAAASSVVMRFEPGALYDFEQCYVNSSDAGASITLASRSYGSRWRLKVYENATGFGRVAVSDCDASAGEVAYAGRNSADEGNNVNWDFSTDVAVWTGGASGDFDDAANWSSGAVPSNSTHVAIIAGDGAAVAVTIQAASSASVGTLVLGAGTGGSASLLARGPIVVAGDAEVRTNCTLTLNAYNDTGAAPNVISNADAVEGIGDSADAAKKKLGRLAGFDELNVISSPSSSGSGSGAATGLAGGGGGLDFGSMTPDTSGVSEFADKVKGIINDLTSWVRDHIAVITATISGIFTGFLVFTKVNSILEGFQAMLGLTNASVIATSLIVAAVIAAIVAALVYLWQTSEDFRKAVIDAVNAVMSILNNIWDNVLKPIAAFLLDVFNSVLVPIAKFLASVFVQAVNTVIQVVLAIWTNILAPFVNFLVDILAKAIKGVTDIWEYWKPIIMGVMAVVQWAWDTVLKPLANFFTTILVGAVQGFGYSIQTVFNGVKKVFSGVIDFVTGVFTGNWKKAWNGIVDIFTGIFQGISGVVKAPINTVIGIVNAAIDKINGFGFSVPDWVPIIGGRSFRVNVPKLNYLARGGIVNKQSLNMLAEGNNPEAVIPLKRDLSAIQQIADLITENMGPANNSGVYEINLILEDGSVLARKVIKEIKDYKKVTGFSPI